MFCRQEMLGRRLHLFAGSKATLWELDKIAVDQSKKNIRDIFLDITVVIGEICRLLYK